MSCHHDMQTVASHIRHKGRNGIWVAGWCAPPHPALLRRLLISPAGGWQEMNQLLTWRPGKLCMRPWKIYALLWGKAPKAGQINCATIKAAPFATLHSLRKRGKVWNLLCNDQQTTNRPHQLNPHLHLIHIEVNLAVMVVANHVFLISVIMMRYFDIVS